MFEEPLLQARVAQFFDRLEMQFVNILQMRKYAKGAVLMSMNVLLRGI